MDYLIDCVCGHDLTRHGESGCRGNGASCPCASTRLEALDGAIEQARSSPWAPHTRSASPNGPDGLVAKNA